MATPKIPLTLRFSSRKEFDSIKRAAKLNKRSLNFFIVEAATRTAEFVIANHERRLDNAPVQPTEIAV